MKKGYMMGRIRLLEEHVNTLQRRIEFLETLVIGEVTLPPAGAILVTPPPRRDYWGGPVSAPNPAHFEVDQADQPVSAL